MKKVAFKENNKNLNRTIRFYLYNKTKHSYIYIYICCVYSQPNDWTDWAEIFCGHSWIKNVIR